ncbi:hypothetical protein AAAZ42_22795 [Bacteroides ovatus]|nr:hypothetical protein [Bacteroides ovatus]MDC2384319.1 hypothetical protein [Bacteroides ovatus]
MQWPNVIQPRPADYTFASMPNPVGSYRRDFTLPDSWKGRDIFGSSSNLVVLLLL